MKCPEAGAVIATAAALGQYTNQPMVCGPIQHARPGLIVAAPSYVYTIARVARMLGEDEALLEDVALMNMEPEDGRLTIKDLDDDVSTTAFTESGVEHLKELIADLKSGTPPK